MSVAPAYIWKCARTSYAHRYLLPVVERILKTQSSSCRIFDLGCGNGALAAWLTIRGYQVTGVDPSETGLVFAQQEFPHLDLHFGSSDDNLAAIYGQFPIVTSLEVVEHVYSAQTYARTLFDLVEPGGVAIVSTPYNGYLKNLALALLNGFDRHWKPENDGGHIKFWSVATLSNLLSSVGFVDLCFYRVGRIPPLAKSMICVARKPTALPPQ